MKANRWVLAALLVFAAAAYADEFWENKPYTEWTLDQCKRLLEEALARKATQAPAQGDSA